MRHFTYSNNTAIGGFSMETYVKFRATTEDKHQIEQNAKQLNLTVSEYLRKMGLHGFAFKYDNGVLLDIVKEMNRIGTNINQIAKVCNESKSVSTSSLQELQIQHSELLTLIMDNLVVDGSQERLIKIFKFTKQKE